MGNNSFNPLYPADEEISDFEEAVREAELYDDTMMAVERRRARKQREIEELDEHARLAREKLERMKAQNPAPTKTKKRKWRLFG